LPCLPLRVLPRNTTTRLPWLAPPLSFSPLGPTDRPRPRLPRSIGVRP
jgi:hypothetical protein